MCLSEPLGQEGTTSEAYPPWHGHRKSCFTLICRIGGFCIFFCFGQQPPRGVLAGDETIGVNVASRLPDHHLEVVTIMFPPLTL